MPDTREKLIELLGADTCTENDCCDNCVYHENEEACVQYLKAKMADHLIANGVTIDKDNNVLGKWIPVTERLPEDDVRVLVYLNSERSYTKTDTDRLKGGKWVRWGYDVTHWMPLPEPPKEDT